MTAPKKDLALSLNQSPPSLASLFEGWRRSAGLAHVGLTHGLGQLAEDGSLLSGGSDHGL
jgi:hypothetical protein